jgi:nicotinate-nucleotide pyrophosphorylase (carboxylating)
MPRSSAKQMTVLPTLEFLPDVNNHACYALCNNLFAHANFMSYFYAMLSDDYLPLVLRALDEDLHDAGDVTSKAIFDTQGATMRLMSKDTGVLAGAAVFETVFHLVDAETIVEFRKRDGEKLEPGDYVAKVSGKTLSLLTAERTAINFLGLLSGIASQARRFVDAADGRIRILDTRKTIPGYRDLAKYAVQIGGAQNHRRGLYDMVLIKDNHIDEAGSITRAVSRVRDAWEKEFRIEVECRTFEEVSEALACEVDIIMLDNMDDELMRSCTRLGNGKVEFEASGNMTLDRIPSVATTGVDSVSVGAITHSVRNFDFSFISGGDRD